MSFCHVKRIVEVNHLILDTADGNHWYIGAMPDLVMRDSPRNTGVSLWSVVVHTVGASKKSTVPVAWARKYLQAGVVLSVGVWVNVIRGTKDSRFISIPNQAIIQLGAVSAVAVPSTRVEKNKIEEMGIYKGGKFPMVGA